MNPKKTTPLHLPVYDGLVTAGEAAHIGAQLGLHYTRQNWRHLAISGELKAFRVGHIVVVRPDDLAAYVLAKTGRRPAA